MSQVAGLWVGKSLRNGKSVKMWFSNSNPLSVSVGYDSETFYGRATCGTSGQLALLMDAPSPGDSGNASQLHVFDTRDCLALGTLVH